MIENQKNNMKEIRKGELNLRNYELLKSIHEVIHFINKEGLTFLYISRDNCSVCHALFPQVIDLLKHYSKIKLGSVKADDVEEVASYFSIFTVPVLLFFLDGKEMLREARIVHLDLLEEKINKMYLGVYGDR